LLVGTLVGSKGLKIGIVVPKIRAIDGRRKNKVGFRPSAFATTREEIHRGLKSPTANHHEPTTAVSPVYRGPEIYRMHAGGNIFTKKMILLR
jgi:hypothetical protein